MTEQDDQEKGGESTLTVVVATVVNALIAVLKFVAGALTGSAPRPAAGPTTSSSR